MKKEIEISKIRKWIKKTREAPKKDYDKDDKDMKYDLWDKGYDACLDALEEFIGDDPLARGDAQ